MVQIGSQFVKEQHLYIHFLSMLFESKKEIRTRFPPESGSDLSCVVEYRGVEPLASTMRMSRADKAGTYTPRRDSDDGPLAVLEWFGMVECIDSDVLLVMQACFLRPDALPRQNLPKK